MTQLGLGCTVRDCRPSYVADYWKIHEQSQNPVDPEEMSQMHHDRGFAFKPHPKAEPFEGDITYGDTSIALSYIRENWRDWSIEGTHTSTIDPYQMIVFLKPLFS